MLTTIKLQGIQSWVHLSRIKHFSPEFLQKFQKGYFTCEPVKDLRLLFKKKQGILLQDKWITN